MARSCTYRVPYRRRREKKTDYRLRKRLVSSKKIRLVIRKSLKHLYLQLIEAKVDGDRVLAHANTKELFKYGWKGGTGNLCAAYLAGLLLGKRALEKGYNYAILDLGMYSITEGNRLFAALKGALDAGMEIPHSEEILPDEDRIRGKHIADYAELLKKENPSKYQMHFSNYLRMGLAPEDIVEHFENIKKEILKG